MAFQALGTLTGVQPTVEGLPAKTDDGAVAGRVGAVVPLTAHQVAPGGAALVEGLGLEAVGLGGVGARALGQGGRRQREGGEEGQQKAASEHLGEGEHQGQGRDAVRRDEAAAISRSPRCRPAAR